MTTAAPGADRAPGYFVTDDEQGRILWRGDPDDPAPQYVAEQGADHGYLIHAVTPAVFDAAAAVYAPDDALVERVARAMFLTEYADVPAADTDWAQAHKDLRQSWLAQARAALAAIREETRR